MIRELLIFFVCAIWPLTCNCALAQDAPQDLGQYVARAMKVFEVPGVSVAIVKDGKVVLAKGYGVRKLGEGLEVDENTMFGIGSNTKAFTTAALATLVDEGRIAWDDPVYGRLPGFAMYDPYVSHEMTIRDLLAHRSGLGLGEGDLLFLYSTYTREQIISKLRFLKPAYSFRSRFGYDNLLYMAAGQVIPAVTGESWDDYISERIFAPLGMKNSNVSSTAFESGLDYGWPHARVDGKLKVIDFQVLDNVGPAGAINSCAADMAKWILLQLNQGKLVDRQGRINFSDYGLGWMVREYRGQKVVSHGGGVSGFVSNVMLLPDHNLGVVVLSNAEEGGATAAILYHVVDHYLHVQDTDWIGAFKTTDEAEQKAAEESTRKAESSRATNSHPSLPLEKYAACYSDAWYGAIHVRIQDGRLIASFDHTPTMIGNLRHWQYDTFKVHWQNPKIEDAFLTFALTPDGHVESLKMEPVSPLADFSFDYRDLFFTPINQPDGK